MPSRFYFITKDTPLVSLGPKAPPSRGLLFLTRNANVKKQLTPHLSVGGGEVAHEDEESLDDHLGVLGPQTETECCQSVQREQSLHSWSVAPCHTYRHITSL